MERVLVITLWLVMIWGTVAATLLNRSGGLESSAAWYRDLAAPFGLWFLLVPIIYTALCEIARRSQSPAVPLLLVRALGLILLAAFSVAYTCVIFHP